MSFSNLSAATKTADAQMVSGRTRIAGIYFTCTDSAASFSLKNGTSGSATALVTINTPAAAGAYDIVLPDMGVLFDSGVYLDVSGVDVTSVTVFFYGGAAA